ncbi:DNA gyrase C-terminal beta-propeller domain-containing protein, partial [Bacillus haynesii]
GARAAGVKGVNLKDGDFVASGQVLDESDVLVLVTQRGSIKRMNRTEFEKTSRAKRGVLMLRELKKKPHRIAGLLACSYHDQITLQTEKGITEEMLVK